jgi:hypothetical protein
MTTITVTASICNGETVAGGGDGAILNHLLNMSSPPKESRPFNEEILSKTK